MTVKLSHTVYGVSGVRSADVAADMGYSMRNNTLDHIMSFPLQWMWQHMFSSSSAQMVQQVVAVENIAETCSTPSRSRGNSESSDYSLVFDDITWPTAGSCGALCRFPAAVSSLEQKVLGWGAKRSSLHESADYPVMSSDMAQSLLRIFSAGRSGSRCVGRCTVHITGSDLVCIFDEAEMVLDVLDDMCVYSSASPQDTAVHGARSHKGFLRTLTLNADEDRFIAESIVEKIEASRRRGVAVKRVLVTGRGIGGAMASLFLLRWCRNIISAASVVPLPATADVDAYTSSSSSDSRCAVSSVSDEELDVKCITFGCPRFMDSRDLDLVPVELSNRIVHIYGEHDAIPLSVTSLQPFYGGAKYDLLGRVIVVADSD